MLLVDDQEEFLEVGQLMLEALGYTVVLANNGREALSLLQQDGLDPDLVILDMVMPEMDGKEVFSLMRQIRADIKVLLCSGYRLDDRAEELFRCGCQGFIQKPFDICQLSHKIREVIE